MHFGFLFLINQLLNYRCQMSILSQSLSCESLLLSLVLHGFTRNVFYIWTVGQIKQDM